MVYHGDEGTPPPEKHAMLFARHLPLEAGSPGPSFSWSLFSNSPAEAIEVVQSDRMMTVVLERLDESLVAMRHYLNWSLADVVMVANRKADSNHPPYLEWPPAAIRVMNETMRRNGETDVYLAASKKLDERLRSLETAGIRVKQEIDLLRDLRKRVKEVRLNPFDCWTV
jgi:hypothetical protein